MARIVALMAVAVLAATPAAALAAAAQPEPQQAPLQQGANQNEVGEQPIPAPAPAPQVDDGSIGGREALLIGVGIVALIGGIWFVISRDAKRATADRLPTAGGPTGERPARASRRSRRLTPAERKRRKRGRAAK